MYGQQQQQQAASSYYPSYAPAMFIPQPGAMNGMTGQMGQMAYPSYSPYGQASSMGSPATSASSPYASYAPPGSMPQSGSPDFHSVLDSFVRSTGLAPQGSLPPDQEAAASTLSQPGVTPAFSWKRLYSFPFYFSTDSAGSGSRINIPYMKQHIRRMSSGFPSLTSSSSKSATEKAVRDANLKSLQSLRQAQEQQKLLQALQSSEMIATYLQQYLKKQDAVVSGGENSIHESAKRPLHYHPQAPTAAVPQSVPSRQRRPSYEATAEPTPSSRPTAEPVVRETIQVPSYYLPQSDQSALAYTSEYANPAELFQRMTQLDDMRRRRTSTAANDNHHQSIADQLNEQLRTRIVNDPSLLSPSSSSSSGSREESLSERLEHLQSLSQGLRSIPAPSSLSPTPSSYSSGSSEEMTSDELLSGQDSQVRPTILTYYADPSMPSMESQTSHSSSKSMAYSSDSSSQPKKQHMKEDPSSVSLSSSYSMSSHY